MNTIALGLLFASVLVTAAPDSTAKAARNVMVTFCRLDNDEAAQLAPRRWPEISALFTSPGPARHGEITVVRDCVVSDAAIQPDDTAGVMVECIALGTLDEKPLRFGGGGFPTGGIKARRNFTLIRTHGAAQRSPAWKIVGPVPAPTLTAEAAIRYVTALRDAATNPKVIRNANLAIAGLKLQIDPARR
jgi:hypothetical protein